MYAEQKQGLLGLKPNAFRTCKDKSLIKLIPKRNNKSPKIITCDSEDNSRGKTIMVNFFDGDNHFTFRHTEAAIEWLIEYSKKYSKGIEVWFANTQYDIGNLFRESQEYLSFTLAGSRFITGKIYQERIKFKDIFNVIPGSSVKSLGKMIGLEKIEANGVFDNEEYCQRDTEIVYWALLAFRARLSAIGVELKNTAASTAFNALLKQYPHLTVNNFTEEDHEFLKQGYYGGRTEVFHTKKVKGEIHEYDIRSCYPAAMRKIPIIDTNSKIYTKKPKFNTREGICELVITTPDDISVPYLPTHADGKLIFPRGTLRGVWTYFEIREAIKLGYKVKKIFKAIEFKSKFDFDLSGFVEKLFALREKAIKANDVVMEYACKILLNAAYGKLAQGNEKTNLVAFEEFHKIKGDFVSEVFPNNQIIVKMKTDHAPSTNFFSSSMITAEGRHNLYQYLIHATKKGRTLLYCDTDSQFFAGPKFEFVKEKPGLGELEYKREVSEAHFILPKTYMLKFKDGTEKYKCKGVRAELAKEFFTKGHAENMQPLKYVETCRKNFFIDQRNKRNAEENKKRKKGKKYKPTNEPLLPFNLWVKKPKSLKSKYDKRINLKNGKTRPIKLNYCIETLEYV